jgi:hypothetical protein
MANGDKSVALRKQESEVLTSEPSAIIQMIERAARDPAVDIDKMQRLLDMKEKMELRVAEQAFNDAMRIAQEKMRPIATDSDNSQTKSKYASYAALDRAVRKIYTDAGFSLSFDAGEGAPSDTVRVVCFVSCAGYTRQYHVDMPADGKGAKGGDVMTKTHAAGSAFTYGQRYLLKLIFNLAIGADDDGNKAGAVLINEKQVTELIELADEIGVDKIKFCRYFKIESLAELPLFKFNDAVAAMESKRKAKK